MKVEKAALELIGLGYDAALAPEKWPRFMERFVTTMNARSALLREVNYKTGSVHLFETVNYDPAYVAAYREHYVHLDYFTPVLLRTPVGAIQLGNEAVSWERQCRTEFGNDYLIAQNIRHVMGITLAKDTHRHLLFALQRATGQRDYSTDELRLIRLLAPHLARSVQINRQVADITTHKTWACSSLDRLRIGVILLDDQGQPVFFNREAERLVNNNTGFTVKRDGLAFLSMTETCRLRHLIANAGSMAVENETIAGGCLLYTGSDGLRLQFQVIPLPRNLSESPWGQSLHSGCVAVFVSSSGGPHLPWKRLSDLHGLSRAEARLASLLADGISLEEAALVLHVSIQTVRTQLKSIFSKTGVTRQAELVALLLSDMLSIE